MLIDQLVRLVDACRRRVVLVLLITLALSGFSAWYAATHLSVSTDTDLLFSSELPWRKRATALQRDFPQFSDLIVAVVEARIPEEAEATANALMRAAEAQGRLFRSVRRPDASPFFEKYGLLLLDTPRLTELMDQTIDAQPFLGQLVADPSARGLFSALALLGMGVTKEDANLGPYLRPLRTFHEALASILSGKPQPLSWQTLLGGDVSDLAGKYRFVLLQPRLNHELLEAARDATDVLREIIGGLEFVKAGTARVRLTGQVPIADEEFATVAEGTIEGMTISTVLVTICLFLAVGTWRLIVPILVTLTVGMLLTLLYATLAVGTLNVISIAFGILYVGMAVDYGMQFSVRFREYRLTTRDTAAAMAMTTRLAGPQIAFAAATTAAGFMAFLPTDFRGVAELGLIAGGSMIIAFLCTLTVMPAVIALCRPRGEAEEVGYAWAARLDPLIVRIRWPIVGLFAGLALVGLALIPMLTFDADPLHTKRQDTEAVSTLRELIESPLTNPYTIEILASDQAVVTRLTERLEALPIVSGVISLFSFIPADQAAKLALIADASTILAPTLQAPSSVAPVTPEDIRLAASTALAQIEPALAKLPSDHPLADIARDLKALVAAPVPTLVAANLALTRFLPEQLDRLRAALSAEPVTRATIPTELARDWVAPDGRYRILVNATQEALSRGAVKDFARAVLAVAPEAAGPAVTIDASSDTITGAFEAAALYSLFGITFLLWIAQRRALDVTLVLVPLLLSAALALVVVVAIGMPLNFANIIALPLLLCAGVAYNVYFVMNWRLGLTNPLGSATFRAVLFAALTDLEAFGALAASGHPGTSSMGVMLLISLGCTLITTVLFLPALLAVIGRPNGAGRAGSDRQGRHARAARRRRDRAPGVVFDRTSAPPRQRSSP